MIRLWIILALLLLVGCRISDVFAGGCNMGFPDCIAKDENGKLVVHVYSEIGTSVVTYDGVCAVMHDDTIFYIVRKGYPNVAYPIANYSVDIERNDE